MTTRERIARLVEQNPEYTQAQIAYELGISRARVSQLLRAEGLQAKRGWPGVGERGNADSGYGASPLVTGGIPIRLEATAVGTIGEMLAAADLMSRGLQVFFPLIRRVGSCDLVTVSRDGSQVERIEVRCGKRRIDGHIVWARSPRHKVDRFAIVLTGEPVQYSPPFV